MSVIDATEKPAVIPVCARGKSRGLTRPITPRIKPRLQSPEKEEARAARALSPEEFDRKVWAPYPRTPVMSRERAWKAWTRAREEDRAAIVAAIPRYAAWLAQKKPDHPVLNLDTFIAQRRFAGFAESASAPAPPRRFYAAAESPQLAAWETHLRATRGRGLPRDRNGGWMVETEWPPGHAPCGQATSNRAIEQEDENA